MRPTIADINSYKYQRSYRWHFLLRDADSKHALSTLCESTKLPTISGNTPLTATLHGINVIQPARRNYSGSINLTFFDDDKHLVLKEFYQYVSPYRKPGNEMVWKKTPNIVLSLLDANENETMRYELKNWFAESIQQGDANSEGGVMKITVTIKYCDFDLSSV